jgi:hypothetical protein|tara:strand:+ start:131 stop:382 length:252 start_codon:yes stop_codon:yes gene_type:complete
MDNQDAPMQILSIDEFYDHIGVISNTLFEMNRKTLNRTNKEKKDLGVISKIEIKPDGFLIHAEEEVIEVDNIEKRIRRYIPKG